MRSLTVRSLTVMIAAVVLVAVFWGGAVTLQRRVTERDDDRLVQFVTVTDGVSSTAVTAEELHLWRDHTTLFETVVARPLGFEPGQDDPAHDTGVMKGARPLVVNGQLKRGVTIDMANRELAALLVASRRLDPLRFKGRTAWTVRRPPGARQPRT